MNKLNLLQNKITIVKKFFIFDLFPINFINFSINFLRIVCLGQSKKVTRIL